jgi:hypothetical protein
MQPLAHEYRKTAVGFPLEKEGIGPLFLIEKRGLTECTFKEDLAVFEGADCHRSVQCIGYDLKEH